MLQLNSDLWVCLEARPPLEQLQRQVPPASKGATCSWGIFAQVAPFLNKRASEAEGPPALRALPSSSCLHQSQEQGMQ